MNAAVKTIGTCKKSNKVVSYFTQKQAIEEGKKWLSIEKNFLAGTMVELLVKSIMNQTFPRIY